MMIIPEKLKKGDTHHYSDIIIQSSDEVRKNLWGSDTCQKNPGLVFEILNKIVKTNLEEGMYVVYDATNINRKKRMNLIKEMRPYCDSIICTVIATPLEIIYFQDNNILILLLFVFLLEQLYPYLPEITIQILHYLHRLFLILLNLRQN